MTAPFTCHFPATLQPYLLRQAEDAAARLLESKDRSASAILLLPRKRDDLPALTEAMDTLRDGARDMVFIGIGGSSLGGQVTAQLAGWGTPSDALAAPTPRLHFLEAPDAAGSVEFFRRLDAGGARFVVISKSGATLETVALCLLALDSLREQGIGDIRRRFLFVAAPGENPLRSIAAHIDAPVLDHDPHLPGRFSCLSAVGILPMLAWGRDPVPLREGAQAALDDMAPAIQGAAAAVEFAKAGRGQAVLLTYGERLRCLGMWHRQLWMESLGKEKRQASLVAAQGPQDHHARLQAWLDGAEEHWFTLLSVPESGYEFPLDARDWGLQNSPLHARNIEGMLFVQREAAARALEARGAPLRRLGLRALDARALGGVLMHFMLETIIAADLLGVEPFRQPAVERVKQSVLADLRREN